jgi:membrane protease YdiL (CAAX protease family)
MNTTARNTNSPSKRAWLALPVIMAGTLSLLYFGALAPEAIPAAIPTPFVDNAFVDGKLKYQIVTLGVALLVLAITYALAPRNARRFYKLGQLNAPAEPVKWLGIKATDTWQTVGRNFALIVSLATGAFIYFNVVQGQSLEPGNVRYLPFILILAALNAFTEEAITRVSVVTALDGLAPRPVIFVISALIFGIPHYFGVPGGMLGALMAGFLGWLLAKSVAEIEGGFWAWFIHFLQDVIIFAGLFLVAL